MPDPFPQDGVETRTPTSIGPIHVIVSDPDGLNVNREIEVRISVQDQNGKQKKLINKDLRPHLTTAQKNGLAALLDNIRARANSEIL